MEEQPVRRWKRQCPARPCHANQLTAKLAIGAHGANAWVPVAALELEERRQEVGRSSEKQSMEEQPVRFWRRRWSASWSSHAQVLIWPIYLLDKFLFAKTWIPVDCRVGNWGAWGKCSSKTKTRKREVLREPKHGGAPCPDLGQTDQCTGGLFPFLHTRSNTKLQI